MTDSERKTAMKVIDNLLGAGFSLGVFDGEEITVSRSTDGAAILEAMGTTDEDYIKVYPMGATAKSKPPAMGWVRFVWGNEDWVAVCDYTTNLEPIMEGVQAWTDEQERTCAASR